MIHRPSPLKKAFTSGLLVIFVYSAIAPAYAQASLWEERKTAVEKMKEAEKPSDVRATHASPLQLAQLPRIHSGILPSLPASLGEQPSILDSLPTAAASHIPITNLKLPLAFANLKSAHFPAGWKPTDLTVLNIQDVHMNAEAQTNISKSLQALIDQGQVDLVALEGAFKDIDISGFRSFEDQKSVQMVADYFLKENKLSGAIHAALVAPSPHRGEGPALAGGEVSFVGVDDQKLHSEHIQAYKDSVGKVDGLKKDLEQAETSLDQKKSQVYNPALLDFDCKVIAYQKGTLPLGDYVKELASKSVVTPSANTFLKALSMENALDFQKVEAERAKMVQSLVNSLSKPQVAQLLNMSVAFRLGKIRNSDFYVYLETLCKKAGVDCAKYPSMKAYMAYALLSDQINAEKFLSEVKAMETNVYASLAKSPEEKSAVARSRNLYLTGKLLDFALTPDEWREYCRRVADSSKIFPVEGDPQSRLRGGISGGTLVPVGKDFGTIRNSLATFETFFEHAQLRDQALTSNLLAQAQSKHAKFAVLVTGGYHTEGVTRLLHEKGIATIALAPKITKIEGKSGTEYLSVFTQEKTPLEKLFDGDKLFVNKAIGPAHLAEPAGAIIGAHEIAVPGDVPSEFEQRASAAMVAGLRATAADSGENTAQVTIPVQNGEINLPVSIDGSGESIKSVGTQNSSRKWWRGFKSFSWGKTQMIPGTPVYSQGFLLALGIVTGIAPLIVTGLAVISWFLIPQRWKDEFKSKTRGLSDRLTSLSTFEWIVLEIGLPTVFVLIYFNFYEFVREKIIHQSISSLIDFVINVPIGDALINGGLAVLLAKGIHEYFTLPKTSIHFGNIKSPILKYGRLFMGLLYFSISVGNIEIWIKIVNQVLVNGMIAPNLLADSLLYAFALAMLYQYPLYLVLSSIENPQKLLRFSEDELDLLGSSPSDFTVKAIGYRYSLTKMRFEAVLWFKEPYVLRWVGLLFPLAIFIIPVKGNWKPAKDALKEKLALRPALLPAEAEDMGSRMTPIHFSALLSLATLGVSSLLATHFLAWPALPAHTSIPTLAAAFVNGSSALSNPLSLLGNFLMLGALIPSFHRFGASLAAWLMAKVPSRRSGRQPQEPGSLPDFDSTMSQHGWGILDTRELPVNRFAEQIAEGYRVTLRNRSDAYIFNIAGIGMPQGAATIHLGDEAKLAVAKWADTTLKRLRDLFPDEDLEIVNVGAGVDWKASIQDENGGTIMAHTDGEYMAATLTISGNSTYLYPDSARDFVSVNFVNKNLGTPLVPPAGTTVVFSCSDRETILKGRIKSTVHSSPFETEGDNADRLTLFLRVQSKKWMITPSGEVRPRVTNDLEKIINLSGLFLILGTASLLISHFLAWPALPAHASIPTLAAAFVNGSSALSNPLSLLGNFLMLGALIPVLMTIRIKRDPLIPPVEGTNSATPSKGGADSSLNPDPNHPSPEEKPKVVLSNDSYTSHLLTPEPPTYNREALLAAALKARESALREIGVQVASVKNGGPSQNPSANNDAMTRFLEAVKTIRKLTGTNVPLLSVLFFAAFLGFSGSAFAQPLAQTAPQNFSPVAAHPGVLSFLLIFNALSLVYSVYLFVSESIRERHNSINTADRRSLVTHIIRDPAVNTSDMQKIVNAIIDARGKSGFRDINDFATRMERYSRISRDFRLSRITDFQWRSMGRMFVFRSRLNLYAGLSVFLIFTLLCLTAVILGYVPSLSFGTVGAASFVDGSSALSNPLSLLGNFLMLGALIPALHMIGASLAVPLMAKVPSRRSGRSPRETLSLPDAVETIRKYYELGTAYNQARELHMRTMVAAKLNADVSGDFLELLNGQRDAERKTQSEFTEMQREYEAAKRVVKAQAETQWRQLAPAIKKVKDVEKKYFEAMSLLFEGRREVDLDEAEFALEDIVGDIAQHIVDLIKSSYGSDKPSPTVVIHDERFTGYTAVQVDAAAQVKEAVENLAQVFDSVFPPSSPTSPALTKKSTYELPESRALVETSVQYFTEKFGASIGPRIGRYVGRRRVRIQIAPVAEAEELLTIAQLHREGKKHERKAAMDAFLADHPEAHWTVNWIVRGLREAAVWSSIYVTNWAYDFVWEQAWIVNGVDLERGGVGVWGIDVEEIAQNFSAFVNVSHHWIINFLIGFIALTKAPDPVSPHDRSVKNAYLKAQETLKTTAGEYERTHQSVPGKGLSLLESYLIALDEHLQSTNDKGIRFNVEDARARLNDPSSLQDSLKNLMDALRLNLDVLVPALKDHETDYEDTIPALTGHITEIMKKEAKSLLAGPDTLEDFSQLDDYFKLLLNYLDERGSLDPQTSNVYIATIFKLGLKVHESRLVKSFESSQDVRGFILASMSWILDAGISESSHSQLLERLTQKSTDPSPKRYPKILSALFFAAFLGLSSVVGVAAQTVQPGAAISGPRFPGVSAQQSAPQTPAIQDLIRAEDPLKLTIVSHFHSITFGSVKNFQDYKNSNAVLLVQMSSSKVFRAKVQSIIFSSSGERQELPSFGEYTIGRNPQNLILPLTSVNMDKFGNNVSVGVAFISSDAEELPVDVSFIRVSVLTPASFNEVLQTLRPLPRETDLNQGIVSPVETATIVRAGNGFTETPYQRTLPRFQEHRKAKSKIVIQVSPEKFFNSSVQVSLISSAGETFNFPMTPAKYLNVRGNTIEFSIPDNPVLERFGNNVRMLVIIIPQSVDVLPVNVRYVSAKIVQPSEPAVSQNNPNGAVQVINHLPFIWFNGTLTKEQSVRFEEVLRVARHLLAPDTIKILERSTGGMIYQLLANELPGKRQNEFDEEFTALPGNTIISFRKNNLDAVHRMLTLFLSSAERARVVLSQLVQNPATAAYTVEMERQSLELHQAALSRLKEYFNKPDLLPNEIKRLEAEVSAGKGTSETKNKISELKLIAESIDRWRSSAEFNQEVNTNLENIKKSLGDVNQNNSQQAPKILIFPRVPMPLSNTPAVPRASLWDTLRDHELGIIGMISVLLGLYNFRTIKRLVLRHKRSSSVAPIRPKLRRQSPPKTVIPPSAGPISSRPVAPAAPKVPTPAPAPQVEPLTPEALTENSRRARESDDLDETIDLHKLIVREAGRRAEIDPNSTIDSMPISDFIEVHQSNLNKLNELKTAIDAYDFASHRGEPFEAIVQAVERDIQESAKYLAYVRKSVKGGLAKLSFTGEVTAVSDQAPENIIHPRVYVVPSARNEIGFDYRVTRKLQDFLKNPDNPKYFQALTLNKLNIRRIGINNMRLYIKQVGNDFVIVAFRSAADTHTKESKGSAVSSKFLDEMTDKYGNINSLADLANLTEITPPQGPSIPEAIMGERNSDRFGVRVGSFVDALVEETIFRGLPLLAILHFDLGLFSSLGLFLGSTFVYAMAHFSADRARREEETEIVQDMTFFKYLRSPPFRRHAAFGAAMSVLSFSVFLNFYLHYKNNFEYRKGRRSLLGIPLQPESTWDFGAATLMSAMPLNILKSRLVLAKHRLSLASAQKDPEQTAQAFREIAELQNRIAAYQPRILVADDDPVMREFWEKSLSGKNWNYTVLSNGQDALDKLNDDRNYYDVIVMDGTMPVDNNLPAVSGYQVIDRALELKYNPAQIILFSADIDAHSDAAARRVTFFRKGDPNVKFSHVVQHIQTILAPSVMTAQDTLLATRRMLNAANAAVWINVALAFLGMPNMFGGTADWIMAVPVSLSAVWTLLLAGDFALRGYPNPLSHQLSSLIARQFVAWWWPGEYYGKSGVLAIASARMKWLKTGDNADHERYMDSRFAFLRRHRNFSSPVLMMGLDQVVDATITGMRVGKPFRYYARAHQRHNWKNRRDPGASLTAGDSGRGYGSVKTVGNAEKLKHAEDNLRNAESNLRQVQALIGMTEAAATYDSDLHGEINSLYVAHAQIERALSAAHQRVEELIKQISMQIYGNPGRPVSRYRRIIGILIAAVLLPTLGWSFPLSDIAHASPWLLGMESLAGLFVPAGLAFAAYRAMTFVSSAWPKLSVPVSSEEGVSSEIISNMGTMTRGLSRLKEGMVSMDDVFSAPALHGKRHIVVVPDASWSEDQIKDHMQALRNKYDQDLIDDPLPANASVEQIASKLNSIGVKSADLHLLMLPQSFSGENLLALKYILSADLLNAYFVSFFTNEFALATPAVHVSEIMDLGTKAQTVTERSQ